MIQVVIADDIQILRQGLKAILSQDKDIQVTGLASNGKEAFERCQEQLPDVVLMDMRMPEYDGAWGITAIKQAFPTVKILVLTTFDDQETVDAAIESGADGYLLKEMEDEAVIRSVKMAHAGVQIFGGGVFDGIRQQILGHKGKNAPSPPDSRIFGLTDRERDIMQRVDRGMDNREIAGDLFLAEGTVRNNISRLLDKLGMKDRTQLAVFAVKNHLD